MKAATVNKQNLQQKIYVITIWAIIIAALVPILRASSLAVFKNDDFFAVNRFIYSGKSPLISSFDSSVTMWKTWQGAYSTSFLIPLFNPINWYSYRLLRIELIFMLSSGVAGLFCIIKMAINHFDLDVIPTHLFALILLPIISYYEYFEIFAWYTGAVAYLIPLVLAEFGISFLFMWNHSKKTFYYIISFPCLFIMTGGSLETTGFVMWIFLLILLLDWMKNGKMNKHFLAAFAFSLACSFLNALAPGNFVRHDNVSLSLNIFQSVLSSVRIFGEDLFWFNSHGTFLIFELFAFILGSNIKNKYNKRASGLIACGLIILPIVTAFPVALGYNFTELGDFSNRTRFVLDVSVIICCIGISALLGYYLKQVKLFDVSKLFVPVLIIVMFLVMGRDTYREVPAKIVNNLENGTLYSDAYQYREMYDLIKNSEDEDVIVTYIPDRVAGATAVEMCSSPEDTDYWINEEMAGYFGKNSIVYLPEGKY